MILITGASGKTGQAIIHALKRSGAEIRALIRHPQHAEIITQLGAKELVIGDMTHEPTLQTALAGIQTVYHICPNMHPAEVAIGQHLIQTARRAGVAHFVYHSVLHPQSEAMPHHWHKLRVEELLWESGLAVTVLQPAAYMQNLLAYWSAITTKGIYRIPYGANTRIAMVDLGDVAEVAAKVLTEEGHNGAVYELAGPEALSQKEVALLLSECLGYQVEAVTQPLEEWITQAQAQGLGAYQIETLAKMFRYYEQYHFTGNANVLNWLLDRPATPLKAFIARQVHE